jgi:hypothetical protein
LRSSFVPFPLLASSLLCFSFEVVKSAVEPAPAHGKHFHWDAYSQFRVPPPECACVL